MKRHPYPLESEVNTDTGLLNIANPDLDSGWQGLRFYIDGSGEECPSGGRITKEKTGLIWLTCFGEGRMLELSVQRTASGDCLVHPTLKNESQTVWEISGYGFGTDDHSCGPFLNGENLGHPVYAHAENLRVEDAPFYGPQFPFIRPLGAIVTRIGNSPAGSIPALALGRDGSDTWLIESQYTRESHRISWQLQWGTGQKRMANRTSRFTWNGQEHILLLPGQSLSLEVTLFQIIQATPDRIFVPYIEKLKEANTFAAESSTLARHPVYCTWNYNIFTNINESDCCARIAIAGRIQKGGWFQLDHGYQPGLDGKPVSFHAPDATGHTKTKASVEVDAFYPNPDNAWDRVRFPSGPQGIVEACIANGLKPSIWWSPRVDRNGKIQDEHPDWILQNLVGDRLDVGHLMLDYSVPEVRDFLELCVQSIVRKWKFEGIKLDFFSWMFEHPKARFRKGGTGLEWKRKFVSMIRSYLGPNGYFLHCISCPLGDPFLGVMGFDAFRAGIDIDSGEWHFHIRSVGWLLPSILTHGKGSLFANIDSCLGKPEIPAIERRSRLNFAYISGGMIETSGPIERFNETMLQEWRRLVDRCDQGGEVRCPDQQAFYGRPLPTLLVRLHNSSSYTFRKWGIHCSIGIFNWTDKPKVFGITPSDVGIEKETPLFNFWTGEMLAPEIGESFSATLPARGSLLLDAGQPNPRIQ